MRILKWIVAAIILWISVSFLVDYILGPEDACMDSGGCWDSIDKVCRNTEPNAQELCDRSKPE